jgi:hypothetical protein
VAGGWRSLHNEKLHCFYSSPSIVRVMKWKARCTHGELRNAFNILVEKPECRKAHGRPRCRWDDNIEIDIR